MARRCIDEDGTADGADERAAVGDAERVKRRAGQDGRSEDEPGREPLGENVSRSFWWKGRPHSCTRSEKCV